MPEFPRKDFRLHVGWRTIKTAVSAMLVAIVYCLIGRNPAFACIGVIFGMGVDMQDSIKNGGNRLFGTLIGGLLSIVVFWIYLLFYPQGGHSIFLAVLLGFSTVVLILLCQYFWPGGVQPGGVVLCIVLFSTPIESYMSYALNRIFDTPLASSQRCWSTTFCPGPGSFPSGKGSKGCSRKIVRSECFSAPRSGGALFFALCRDTMDILSFSLKGGRAMPAELHTTLTPDTPVRYLKGVGPKTAERFEKLGILTLSDLLCHYPRRYLDFSKPYSIAEAPADTECVVKAEVFAKPGGRILPGGRRMERITAGDDVSSLEITWFNNPYAAQKLELGQEYYFQGIVTGGMLRRQMVNPQVRTDAQVKSSPFEAVYPQTEGLTSSAIAKCVRQLLPHAELLPDPLPSEMLKKYRLLSKADAVRAIHCPATEEEAFAARRRLIYEELLVLQLGIGRMKNHGAASTGAPMKKADASPFWESPALLPHRRTAAGRGRDPDRHVGRNVHEPPFAGRRGQRQNAGGRCGHLGLHPGRVSSRTAGPHRDPGQPARREPEPPALPLWDAGGPAHRRHESRRTAHHPRRHPGR